MKISGRAYWNSSLFLALLVLFCSSANADSDKGMTLKVMVEQEIVVTNKNGKKETRRVAATRIVPGNEVIYTIHYLNSSDKPAENVFISIPVAEHTRYRSGSARGGDTDIRFSVDGGRHFGKPEELIVTLKNGGKRPATAADYTHIKWRFNVPVPPGASGAVSYRAVLE
ncbi:MAG TPA: hypothetical protein ENK38_01395 [Gammaproteobacteria bacterium]|nr:hypothetical protein [Gammaproteobacteria bacterium]